MHDVFKIRLKSLNSDYACNFKAMDEEVICENISSIKSTQMIDDLKTKGIVITDIESENKPVDILIGANVAGKLFTGKQVQLLNGLRYRADIYWTKKY